MKRVTMADFPGAPRGSYVFEDSWLIVNDEAWTVAEWAAWPFLRPRAVGKGRPVEYDDKAHRKDREKHRRYNARRRAA